MSDEHRGFWESLRLWLNAVGIPVVLGVMGLYQFYLKEVFWPETAVNLTADVTVKEAGFGAAAVPNASDLEAIELVITARNPSSNTIYLTENYWAACGVTISAFRQSSENSQNWLDDATALINARRRAVAGKHYRADQATLVDTGSVFRDGNIKANEKLSRTFVFYVPRGLYDLVTVDVYIPATTKEDADRLGGPNLRVEYTHPDCSENFVGTVIVKDTKEKLPVPIALMDHGWQGFARSRVELSLWESKPSAPIATVPRSN